MVKSFEECKVFLAKKPLLFHVKDDYTMYLDMQESTYKEDLKKAVYKQVKCRDGVKIQWYQTTIKKYTVAFDIHVMMENSQDAVNADTNMFLVPQAKEIWETHYKLFLERSKYMICFPTEQWYFFDKYQEELSERELLPDFVFVRRYTFQGKKGKRIVKIQYIQEEKQVSSKPTSKQTKKGIREQVLQAMGQGISKEYEKKYNKQQLYDLAVKNDMKLPKSTTKANIADVLAKQFGRMYLA
jgi:hypothetical protein